MSEARVYLGDGVYADLEYGDIVLTTENGYETTNRIVLDPVVLDALLRYAEHHLPRGKKE